MLEVFTQILQYFLMGSGILGDLKVLYFLVLDIYLIWFNLFNKYLWSTKYVSGVLQSVADKFVIRQANRVSSMCTRTDKKKKSKATRVQSIKFSDGVSQIS